MNARQRAEWCVDKAKKLGMDGPNEDLICEAIRDAEFNAVTNREAVAADHGLEPCPRCDAFREAVAKVRTEVNCRIEHGAESGGHLEYVQARLDAILHPVKKPNSRYGYCPYCGEPGKTRERRPNGNDTCTGGHVYPSAKALKIINMGGEEA